MCYAGCGFLLGGLIWQAQALGNRQPGACAFDGHTSSNLYLILEPTLASILCYNRGTCCTLLKREMPDPVLSGVSLFFGIYLSQHKNLYPSCIPTCIKFCYD